MPWERERQLSLLDLLEMYLQEATLEHVAWRLAARVRGAASQFELMDRRRTDLWPNGCTQMHATDWCIPKPLR